MLICLTLFTAIPTVNAAQDATRIPILCYHNLNPTTKGSMNMTPERFESQIKWLVDSGFHIIPLQEAVEFLQGKRDSLPTKPIVITADDGWKSDYLYMLPIVKKYNIPVTLFIYPQTISTGKNALTWEEVAELQQTKLFDVQGHTYDHPNFKHAKRSMSPERYAKYLQYQLAGSKKILEEKLNKPISYLAWPFGIYDRELEAAAANAGYVMAFTIDARTAKRDDRPMAVPRFMIIDAQTTKTFYGIANQTRTAHSSDQAMFDKPAGCQSCHAKQ